MKLLFAVAVILGVGLGGCIVHAHPAHPHGAVVIKDPVCSHHAGCGHYKHGNAWYHAPGHSHAHGCGHVLRGGVWVVVD